MVICIVVCYPSKLYLLTMSYRLYSYRAFRMMIVMEMMITWILLITGKVEGYSSNSKIEKAFVLFLNKIKKYKRLHVTIHVK